LATVTVKSDPTNRYTTHIQGLSHTILADEPAPYGDDLGPSPYELLLASLGACTSMTLQMYARRKGWPLEEVRITLMFDRVHAGDASACEEPETKIERISRNIELIGPLDDAQRKRLIEIAGKCPVHKTLLSKPTIEDHLIVNTEPML
jgi:putative redox protein